MARTFWVETLGCPKNQVDSDKLAGVLRADGLRPAAAPELADVVVVNTCAFIDEARAESVEAILELDAVRRDGSRLVVTGCLAERSGDELAAALPEVDAVSGFGVPVAFTAPRRGRAARAGDDGVPVLDLLTLPRPPSAAPWAYVKVAEGCDRACGFCAIPQFRGPQRSRPMASVLAEVEALVDPAPGTGVGVREVVLVAQDLAAYGRDQGRGEKQLVELVPRVAGIVERVRLLYLYPSELTDRLLEVIVATGVPYFDLSLQHVAPGLLRRMRRWGGAERFAERIARIRSLAPDAALRSNFIVGYPGETEDDHDALLGFVEEQQLDWCGFFAFSREAGTVAAALDGAVPDGLVAERLAELRELQDRITAARRDALVGTDAEVLVDEPGVARSHREAPEIDGVVEVPASLPVGELADVRVVDARGPDLVAVPSGRPVDEAPVAAAGARAGSVR